VTSIHAQRASAAATEEASEDLVKILVDSSADKKTTNIEIVAPNWPGILASVTDKFKVLELEVIKASVDLKDGYVFYKFCVQDQEGNAVVNFERLQNVEKALRRVLNPALWSDLGKNVNLTHSIGDPETQRRRRLLWLMDQYLKNDVPSIQKSIVDHVEYTIARSRFKFDDFEAYKGVRC
jgi:starch phosphorylase